MKFELLQPAEQLVAIMERIYRQGLTTTSGGNLSIRDADGNIWITPAGIDKGSLTTGDIVLVKRDGTVAGKHKPSSELPFHQSIYMERPDINAVLHAHPPALVSFSIVRKIPDIRLTASASLVCGEVAMAEYGLPGSADLGKKIAAVLKRGTNAALLENHGIVVVNEDLLKAFVVFETLDHCAQLQINALRIGKPAALAPSQFELALSSQQVMMQEYLSGGGMEGEGSSAGLEREAGTDKEAQMEKDAREELCKLAHRCCDQKLFTSILGSFSVRLDDKSFLITPDMADRKYLEPGDIVRIEEDGREAGEAPDTSVLLHKYIYQKHTHVNSVILASPAGIMAFAVTGESFDSRTIPESYIMLRNIGKLPFGSTFTEPQKTADLFTEKNPLALVENECLIVTGTSPINAFDRLEVAEYSAKALIASKAIGEVFMIDGDKIRDIEIAFKLP